MSIRYRKEPLWLLRDLPKYIKKKHTFSEDSRILDHEWCYVIYFHCLKHSVFRILRSVFMADFSTDLSVKHLLNSMSLEADCSHGAYYHFAFSGWAAGQPAKLTAAWNVLRVLINNKKKADDMENGISSCITLTFVWTQILFCKLNNFYLNFLPSFKCFNLSL